LLLQRLKRSQSQTLLWGEAAPPLPPAALAQAGGSAATFAAAPQPTASAVPTVSQPPASATATEPSEVSVATAAPSGALAREPSGNARPSAAGQGGSAAGGGGSGPAPSFLHGSGGGIDGSGALPQRLLVVANRLPVSAYKDKEGVWQFEVWDADGMSRSPQASCITDTHLR